MSVVSFPVDQIFDCPTILFRIQDCLNYIFEFSVDGDGLRRFRLWQVDVIRVLRFEKGNVEDIVNFHGFR